MRTLRRLPVIVSALVLLAALGGPDLAQDEPLVRPDAVATTRANEAAFDGRDICQNAVKPRRDPGIGQPPLCFRKGSRSVTLEFRT